MPFHPSRAFLRPLQGRFIFDSLPVVSLRSTTG